MSAKKPQPSRPQSKARLIMMPSCGRPIVAYGAIGCVAIGI